VELFHVSTNEHITNTFVLLCLLSPGCIELADLNVQRPQLCILTRGRNKIEVVLDQLYAS
jgi:hypothetical protein